jgi:hypothetical protein
MRRAKVGVGLFLMLCCGGGAMTALAQTTDPLAGTWTGTLVAAPGAELRVVFHIVADSTGRWNGTMDSPDQGATGIPVESATLEDGKVVFAIPAVNGGYSGTLSEDGKSIEGTWSQGGNSLALRLERVAEPAGAAPMGDVRHPTRPGM